MLTFKKIALLGVAALTAFSMSCSDTADDSGSFAGLTITDSATGIFLSGTITGNDGILVKGVTATADGKPVTVSGINGLPTSPVSLSGAYLSGVCGDSKGSKTYSIVITATFSDETSISETKSVLVDCGTVPVVPAGTYTLSLAGESYLDVDGQKTYNQSRLTDAIKEDIDLVAYWSSNAGDKIYSGTWNNVTTLSGASDARIFKTKAALDAAADDDDELGEATIDIVNGLVFYLESTEVDPFKVTVTATATNSVTLKVEGL